MRTPHPGNVRAVNHNALWVNPVVRSATVYLQ